MLTLPLVLSLIAIGLVYFLKKRRSQDCAFSSENKAPGPKPWPLIGSLHLLGGYENPFDAFTALSKIYGDIYSITLGSSPCVVVNTFEYIKEVLITKGADFGGRPDFMRYHKLFGGDRNNSLALCDWSILQKTRRNLARTYCSPRFTSLQFEAVNKVAEAELSFFLKELDKLPKGQLCDIKPVIMRACANMFTRYMCSTRFDYADKDFQVLVRTFDEIFWEINQGYAVDFLPWLMPFYNKHMKKLSDWAGDIRQFIMSHIVNSHLETIDYHAPPRDFTDALLIHLKEDPSMEWQHIIFELEDFLGGSSAVGNLVMVTIASVVNHPEIAERIQSEVSRVTGNDERNPGLFDKIHMPYTEAVVWEALRWASSPIVPHVASTDTSIGNYRVEKGTVVLLNNYELNKGDSFWEAPQTFKPERFISSSGRIVKPPHFIPFSTGKRTCIGQRLVQCFSFTLLATLFQNYNISTPKPVKIKSACIAVPPDCFKVILTPRKVT